MSILDFSNIPDTAELPKGEYDAEIVAVSSRKDDLGRVKSIEISMIHAHEEGPREVKDYFRFENAWSADRDLKRARKLAEMTGLLDGNKSADFSEENLVGKKIRAYVKFEDFWDTNVVRRYVKPSVALDDVLA